MWGVVGIEMGIGFMVGAVLAGLQIAMPGEPGTVMAIYWCFTLASRIIQVWLGIGMNLALLKIARGQPVSFDVLFSGGQYLLRSILALIMFVLAFLAIAFVPLVMGGVIIAVLRDQVAILLGVLISGGICWVGLLLYVWARLGQFYWLVIDQDAGAFESMQRAWEISGGRAGTIILVYVSQAVFLIAGILAFCVGVVVAIPFCSLLLVVTYLSLAGRAKPAGGTAQQPVREWFTNWEEEL